MMRVGLLEDDIAIQEMILLVLQDEGYTVVNYPDAETCLNALGVNKNGGSELPIDLLIADWRLSGAKTGIEVIRQLRANAHLTNLPIILTTAATFSDLEELKRLHVTLLEKPFSVDDIINLIKQLITPNSTV